MSEAELTVADIWATGVSPDRPHPALRERLTQLGAVAIDHLGDLGGGPAGDPESRPPRVLVCGLVTHR